jgi:hypothetical protein
VKNSVRAYALLAAVVLFSCNLYAYGRKDVRKTLPAADKMLSSFFFEILRYDTTGFTVDAKAKQAAGVSAYPARILLHAVWMNGGYVCYMVEKAYPECAGKIDSSFDPYDFEKMHDDSWIEKAAEEAAAPAEQETALAELEMQPPEETAEKKEQPESAGESAPSERRYRDAEGRLRLFSFGTEHFAADEDGSGGFVFISTEGKHLVRRYFDGIMRLMKKETWTINTTAADSVKDRTDTYSYDGDSLEPGASVSVMKNSRIETLYGAAGKPETVKGYETDDGGMKRITSATEWKYTGDGKIAEEKCTVYQYKKGKKKPAGQYERREVYEYPAKNRNPDYYYYEDGVLHMKTVYTSDDAYETTLVFSGGYTVTADYAHGRKVKEVFLKDGEVQRSVSYDEEKK